MCCCSCCCNKGVPTAYDTEVSDFKYIYHRVLKDANTKQWDLIGWYFKVLGDQFLTKKPKCVLTFWVFFENIHFHA